MTKIKNVKWFNACLYFSIIFLSGILLLAFYNMSDIIYNFPLKPSDTSEHMARFYFMLEYGFHGNVPNWYGGYSLFLSYPPMFSYFMLPFFMLTSNIQVSFYIAMISLYVLVFVATMMLCKEYKLSFVKSLAVFLIIFAGRFSIFSFFEAVRFGELIGWVSFLLMFTLLTHYKKSVLDLNFMIFYTVLSSILILSYFYAVVFSSMLILPFIFLKKNKEKLLILFSSAISFLITSFWWLPYITNYFFEQTYKQLSFLGATSSIVQYMNHFWITIIPISFCVIFYLYSKNSRNSKEDLILFLPTLIVSILTVTRIAAYVPVLNEIGIYPYCSVFLLLTLLLFFNEKLYSKFAYKAFAFFVLIIFPLSTAVLYLYPTNEFFIGDYAKRPMVKDVISTLPSINGSFLILPETEFFDFYFDGKPFYCYGAIHYNFSTPSGWYPPAAKSGRIEAIKLAEQAVRDGNCTSIVSISKGIGTEEIISYKPYCDKIAACDGIETEMIKDYTCLFRLS